MTQLLPIGLRGAHGTLEVFAHGGHVARWTPHGQAPVLFVSRASRFVDGEPIRGGIPVIFPWFGDDPERRGRPAHGFARRRTWQRVDGGERAGEVAFELADDEATRSVWPHRFGLRLAVHLGTGLDLTLRVTNRDEHAFRCELALHTYLAVGDVREVSLTGLEGAPYADKVTGGAGVERAQPLRFVGETDRVYQATNATCHVDDPVLGRRLAVAKTGADSTIVWNPWHAKAARMADLADDEWPSMLCVESGSVGTDAVELQPGAWHEMSVRIGVEPRTA